MTRFLNRTTQMVLDLGVLSLALWVAFFARFDGYPPFLYFKRLIFVWPYVVLLQYACLSGFGVPRFSWRFIGLREITRIFAALGLAASVLLTVRFAAAALTPYAGHVQYVLVPLGVILIDFAVAFMGIAGIRAVRRLIAERADTRRRAEPGRELVPTILIGAGQAGLLVAKELTQRPELGMTPVGFLDDDPLKQGTVLHGIKVLGTTHELPQIAARNDVRQALISIAAARAKDIRRIGELCRAEGLRTKIIPGIYEIVGGRVNLSRIRELQIEDLLGREPVQLDETALSGAFSGRVILISGAGGSIGSELCEQICRFHPAKLILVERSENALFEVHRTLLSNHPELEVVPCVADVCDEQRIDSIFAAHAPEVVFHAAAHKHVPMMETNVGEAIKNNIGGTRTLADIAARRQVKSFVMISTDKAVNPTSVMGATKRVAELYVQALAMISETAFVTVRFGNVLGSAGSVIPIFKQQIAHGGPVTVTHPEMCRYFMTIPEACQLVMQAGTMGEGGEIFVLDMGEPVKIVDLARDMIRLCGLTPDEDVQVQFTGMRLGEKLFEELSIDEENADRTRHPKIFVGKGLPRDLGKLAESVDELVAAAEIDPPARQRARLRAIVPEYLTTPVGATSAGTNVPTARGEVGPVPALASKPTA